MHIYTAYLYSEMHCLFNLRPCSLSLPSVFSKTIKLFSLPDIICRRIIHKKIPV